MSIQSIYVAGGFVHVNGKLLKMSVNVQHACAGYGHALMLTAHGDLWVYGDNSFGQCCYLTKKTVFRTPTCVMSGVLLCDANANFSAVLTKEFLFILGNFTHDAAHCTRIWKVDTVQFGLITKIICGLHPYVVVNTATLTYFIELDDNGSCSVSTLQ